MKGPSLSEMTEISPTMPFTKLPELAESSGNCFTLDAYNLRLSESDKDSAFSSDGGQEYDLADHIDRLTLYSEGDFDDRILDEFGAGDKRRISQSQDRSETDYVPSKRSYKIPIRETRPPPHKPFVQTSSQNNNGLVLSDSNQAPKLVPQTELSLHARYAVSPPSCGNLRGFGLVPTGNASLVDGDAGGFMLHSDYAWSGGGGSSSTSASVQSLANQECSLADGNAGLPSDVCPDGELMSMKSQKIQEIMKEIISLEERSKRLCEAGGQQPTVAVGPPVTRCQAMNDREPGLDLMHGAATKSRQDLFQVSGPPAYGHPIVSMPTPTLPSMTSAPVVKCGPFEAVARPPPIIRPTNIGSGLTCVTNLGPVAIGPPNMGPCTSPPDRFKDSNLASSVCNIPVVVNSPGKNLPAASTNSVLLPKPPPVQTHCINSGMSGGTVTHNDMSPTMPQSPFLLQYPCDSNGSCSHEGRNFSEVDSSPFSSNSVATHSLASPTSPYQSPPPQVSPGAYPFPPTPISPESDGHCSRTDLQSPKTPTLQDSNGSLASSCHSPVSTALSSSDGQPNSVWSGAYSVTSPGAMTSLNGQCLAVLQNPVHHGQNAAPAPQAVPENSLTPRNNCVVSSSAGCDGSRLWRVGEEGNEEEGGKEVVFVEEGYRDVDYDLLDDVCDDNGVWVEDSAGEGDTFLHSLSGIENEEVAIEYLRRLRPKPGFFQVLNKHNKISETPLYSAVSLGRANLAAAMIQCGADVNLQCCFEAQAHTPLHKAVTDGNAAMVETLLSSPHINVNAGRYSDRCTPLMLAIMKHVPYHPNDDRLDIIKLIMEEEDTLDLKAREQRSSKTAVMMGVETKDLRVLDVLLDELDVGETRELINMQNWAGNTSLHLAAGMQQIPMPLKERILSKLIRLGGEPDKKNNEGQSPRDWTRGMIERIARPNLR